MLVDDAGDEAVDAGDEAGAAGAGALQVEAGEPWEVVGPVELAEQVVAFVDEGPQLPDLVALLAGVQLQLVPPAEHRPHHVVERRAAQDAADLDGGAGGGIAAPAPLLQLDGADHLARDDRALGRGRRDLPRGEEVRGRHPPQRAPVRAVGREPDGAVEQQPVRGLLHGAVGERRAVQDLPRHVRVRRHDHPRLPERQRHQPPRPRRLRRRGELPVRQPGHEPHAADHRQPPQPRNSRHTARRPPTPPPRPPPPPPRRPSGEGPVQQTCNQTSDGANHDEPKKPVRLAVAIAGAFSRQGEVEQPAASVLRSRH
ncbi:Os09g0528500, partial [Oryza sativa Japonica Group]